MKLDGEQVIDASRAAVWQALNDPRVLQKCIPGCEALEQDGENRFKATVAIKVGPIGARFAGAVELSDLVDQTSYRLTGQGQGGVAGSAKGTANVSLEDHGQATRLVYSVDAEVGGRLAQLGGAIIEVTAKQLAGRFFAALAREIQSPEKIPEISGAAAIAATGEHAASQGLSGAAAGSGISMPLFVVALLAAFALGAIMSGANLMSADSLTVVALLAIVAIASRLGTATGSKGSGG